MEVSCGGSSGVMQAIGGGPAEHHLPAPTSSELATSFTVKSLLRVKEESAMQPAPDGSCPQLDFLMNGFPLMETYPNEIGRVDSPDEPYPSYHPANYGGILEQTQNPGYFSQYQPPVPDSYGSLGNEPILSSDGHMAVGIGGGMRGSGVPQGVYPADYYDGLSSSGAHHSLVNSATTTPSDYTYSSRKTTTNGGPLNPFGPSASMSAFQTGGSYDAFEARSVTGNCHQQPKLGGPCLLPDYSASSSGHVTHVVGHHQMDSSISSTSASSVSSFPGEQYKACKDRGGSSAATAGAHEGSSAKGQGSTSACHHNKGRKLGITVDGYRIYLVYSAF